MKKPIYWLIPILITLVLISCGKKSESDGAPQQTPPASNIADGTQPGIPSAKPSQSGVPIAIPSQPAATSSQPSFSVTKELKVIRRSLVNGSVGESYALFVIKPNIPGLSVTDVLLDGTSLTDSTRGFSSGNISRGKINANTVKPMLSGSIGFTADEKQQLVDTYLDGLFIYSENHSFNFSEDGTVHKIKIVAGKDGVRVGEYEFVVDTN